VSAAPTTEPPRSPPRIPPGTTAEIGRRNAQIAAVLGRATGSGPPNLFTTVGRHRRLFLPWLRFAGTLMPRGSLPRADSELVILRVAHNCACDYEWRHHERIGPASGVPAELVARVRDGASAGVFSPRQVLLLRTADALHEHRDIGDDLWSELRGEFSDVELIELCMLVGHYEMLAMTLNSLRVAPDKFGDRRPSRLLAALGNRKQRR
jgi:alkylhydroperoxidase family enzyme